MSRFTSEFTVDGKVLLLTISNHGYYQVFDKLLREKAGHSFTLFKTRKGKWIRKNNPAHTESLLYEGRCKGWLVDKLSTDDLRKKAAQLLNTYIRVTSKRSKGG